MLAALEDGSSVSIATAHSSAQSANATVSRPSTKSSLGPMAAVAARRNGQSTYDDEYDDDTPTTRRGVGADTHRKAGERDREAVSYVAGVRHDNHTNNNNKRRSTHHGHGRGRNSDDAEHGDTAGMSHDDRSHFDAIFAPPVRHYTHSMHPPPHSTQ